MSTYYYIGCDACKKRSKIAAVCRLYGRHLDNHDDILDFLFLHYDCDSLKFFSEHDDDRFEYAAD